MLRPDLKLIWGTTTESVSPSVFSIWSMVLLWWLFGLSLYGGGDPFKLLLSRLPPSTWVGKKSPDYCVKESAFCMSLSFSIELRALISSLARVVEVPGIGLNFCFSLTPGTFLGCSEALLYISLLSLLLPHFPSLTSSNAFLDLPPVWGYCSLIFFFLSS